MIMATGVIFLLAVLGVTLSTPLDLDLFSLKKHIPRMPVLSDAPIYPDVRITEGQPAKREEFPYQTCLIIDQSMLCGGSLISSQWILTAAHCVHGFNRFGIYLGIEHRSKPEWDYVVLSSTTKIVHSGYNKDHLRNDIALVHLPSKVKFSEYISPVTLPTLKQSPDFIGKTANVSGWGRISDLLNKTSDDLKYAGLEIISNPKCRETYSKDIVRSSVICARGQNGQSVCNGDSGGALVISNGTSHLQIGIVSFSAAKGCSNYPAGFTRITYFLSWILANSDVGV